MSRVHGMSHGPGFSGERAFTGFGLSFSFSHAAPYRGITGWSVDRGTGEERGRVTFRGGWSLGMSCERAVIHSALHDNALVIRGATRYWLDGLGMTQEQAGAVMRTRGTDFTRPDLSMSWSFPPGWGLRMRMDGIELTQREAQAIADGEDPLGIVIPGVYVRVLGEQELMAR